MGCRSEGGKGGGCFTLSLHILNPSEKGAETCLSRAPTMELAAITRRHHRGGEASLKDVPRNIQWHSI
jgi:hypothetical protein